MKERVISTGLTVLTAIIAVWAMAAWYSSAPAFRLDDRLAIPANERAAQKAEMVNIEGEFRASTGKPSALPGSWPRFRGGGFDNISRGPIKLADSWDKEGPPLLWSVNLGEGYAGAAVKYGRVFVLDYDHEENADALRCLSLDDGKEIWRRWYKVRIKRNHGMSRTVPAVTDKYVVTIGPRCHVMCVDPATGDFKWGIDLQTEFETKEPLWYTGQCPLIDNGVAVIAPGGKALMAGIDCETGKVAWQTSNPRKWQMSHSSIVPMTIDGTKMYVYCAMGGVAGVSAEPGNRGEILWETKAWNHSVIAPAPVPLDSGKILLTAGYGAGSMIIQVKKSESGFSTTSISTFDKKVFACEQHTPVYYNGLLYTVMPSDAGALKRQLVCIDASGKPAWNSGKEHRFGMGPFMIADNKILIMNDDGLLTMARADNNEYTPLAQAQVLHGRESWGPFAIADGRLLARDFTRMICLDLRESQ